MIRINKNVGSTLEIYLNMMYNIINSQKIGAVHFYGYDRETAGV